MKILQPLKKFHFANPLQKSEIFDPLRKSRQRGVCILNGMAPDVTHWTYIWRTICKLPSNLDFDKILKYWRTLTLLFPFNTCIFIVAEKHLEATLKINQCNGSICITQLYIEYGRITMIVD